MAKSAQGCQSVLTILPLSCPRRKESTPALVLANRSSHQFERWSHQMPLYTITTEEGLLSTKQKDEAAAGIVRIHTEVMNVPADFVHLIYFSYPKCNSYVAGK